MYWKIYSVRFFNMMPPYDLNLMNSKVVALKQLYLFPIEDLKIHIIAFEHN